MRPSSEMVERSLLRRGSDSFHGKIEVEHEDLPALVGVGFGYRAARLAALLHHADHYGLGERHAAVDLLLAGASEFVHRIEAAVLLAGGERGLRSTSRRTQTKSLR